MSENQATTGLLAGCPFCDWTQEVEASNTFGGRLQALMVGQDHALAEHMDEIERYGK